MAVSITNIQDNVNPNTGSVTNGYTNDTSPVFSGSVTNGLSSRKVVLFKNGAYVGETVVNGASWSISPGAFAPGEYNFSVKSYVNTIIGWVEEDVSGSYHLVIDTSAPSAPGVSLVSDTGPTGDSVTSNTALSVSSETGAAVEYSTNNASWSSAAPTFNSDGAKTVYVRQTDKAGNVSPTTTFTFTRDTAAPSAPTGALTSDTGSSSSDGVTKTGAWTVSGVETGAKVEYLVGGAWTTVKPTAVEGDNTFTFRQTDLAGNVSSNGTLSFKLDTAAPSAPTGALTSDTGSSSSDGVTKDGAWTVSGVETGAKVEYLVGGAWTTVKPTAVEGDNTFTFRQTDLAGNVSSNGTLSFTLDTAAPSAPTGALTSDTGSSSSDGVTNNGAWTISGVETGAKVEYLVGGAWTTVQPTAVEGDNTFTFRQTDLAGNVSSNGTLSFKLDTAAPSAPTGALTSDTGSSSSDGVTKDGAWTVSGVETGAKVEYLVGGAWTTVKPTAVEGDNTFTFRQTDLAGNVSSNGTLSFTLDTAAPSAPTGALTSDTGSSSSDGVTNNGAWTVSGVETGAKVEYLVGGAWTTVQPVAVEGDNTFAFRQTDKAGNVSSNGTVTIALDTSAPVFTSGSTASFAENASSTVYTAATTDAHAVTLSLSGADANKFDFDAATGKLTFKAAPNFEGPSDTGNNNVYDVTITATDLAGNVKTQDVAITVTDVNDNAPVFTSTAAPSVAENTKAVVDLTSTDVDTVGGPVTYAITGGADAAKFVIVGGQLQFVSAPDYETQAHSYAVQVTANDGANTTVQNLTVALTDTNDVTPVITSGSAVNFAENGAGTVYTATSTDGDSSAAFRNVSYSLAAGGDNNLFNIDSTTGALTFKAAPNFEAPQDSDKNNSYVLTVQAFDGVNTGTKTVTVNVTDLVEDSGPANTAGLTITSTNATINDATPLITGSASTAQAGQTVTLFEGATARGTGVVQTNGTWSIESANVGADGAHSFTAQLGSSVSNSVTLTIDTVAPVVTITGTTGTGFSPTVNGTASVADIGRTVAILDGTSVVGSGTVGAGGAFSVSTGLTGTGPHGLTARVVDLAGNVGTSAVNTYTIAPQPAQGQIDSDNLDAAYLNIMDAASLRAGDKDFMLDLKTKLSVNLVTYKEALDAVIDRADGSTSVATLSYQFFTGKIPTKAGMDYLVSETGGNANNINSAYYQTFNIENRYINFAVNLGHDGAGKDAFQTKYGALSLFDATKKAYTEIFGTAATDTKVHELLDTTMSFGGKTITRADYFANYGHDAIGTKAAMVGWLLSEAAKADVGTYATANEAFLSDLADGATFNVDLIGTYGAKAIPLEVLG